MYDFRQFYIDGDWTTPHSEATLEVINPATEEVIGCIAMGDSIDTNKAVAAAKSAFDDFATSEVAYRIELLERLLTTYEKHYADIAHAISDEMGAPLEMSFNAQAAMGKEHLAHTLTALRSFEFEKQIGKSKIIHEPVGVCALITPWNWPINQIVCKVAPALASGCTTVLKPSEVSPLSAYLFAQVCHEAELPAGIFNLVNGDGAIVGETLSKHPDVDMVSFTGSTRAGSAVTKAAADTVKRVSLELGGKSANIILDDADFESAITRGVLSCMFNAGQSCNAPTRLLVPETKLQEVNAIAIKAAKKITIGDPKDKSTIMGPVVSDIQYRRIQSLIQVGIDEGATLLVGGTGKPEGLKRGYFVKPTIFTNVNNRHGIAREEIFGPVLVVIPYKDENEAVAIANDSDYGLSGYVSSGNRERAHYLAKKLRVGMVHINNASTDPAAPFGGYKQSGNGREWGVYGLEEFMEIKAVME